MDPLTILSLVNDKEIIQTPVGGLMHHCSRCAQLQPHELIQVIERKPVVINREHERPLHMITVCEVCHHQSIHNMDTPLPCLERWNPDSNLRDYAMRSGHQLDPEHRLLDARSVSMMLGSILSMDAKSAEVSPKDYTFLASIFLCSAALAGWIFTKTSSNDPNAFIQNIFVLLGIPLAGFISGILAILYRRHSRIHSTRRRELQARINRLGITSGEIVALTPHEALRDQNVYFLLKPFM